MFKKLLTSMQETNVRFFRDNIYLSLRQKRKAAFTLAEVLTTLIVIGVIAALVVPSFVKGIHGTTYDTQKKNFESKLYAGMSRMRVDGLLNKTYDTTEEFIEQFRKYFKIDKVCNKEELKNCFTAKTVQDYERTIYAASGAVLGETISYNTEELKTAKDLIPQSSWESDVVGLVFSDGVQALFTFNPDGDIISPYNMEADPTANIALLYDINPAKRSPNTTDDDIGKYNLYADVDFPYTVLGRPVGCSYNDCLQILEKNPEITKTCSTNGSCTNSWIAAYNMCKGIGKNLPSYAQLRQFRDKLDVYASSQYYSRNKKLRDKLLWTGNGNPAKLYGQCSNPSCSNVYALMTWGDNYNILNDTGYENVRTVTVICVD